MTLTHNRAAAGPVAQPVAYGAPTAPFLPIVLEQLANNRARSGPDDLEGGFNVWRNTLPAEYLPEPGTELDVARVPFVMARSTPHGDNVRCDGQMLTLPQGRYDWVHLLASSERRTEDEVALHFADGQVDFESVRVSDFWAPPAATFDEPEAVRTPVMHYPRHVQQNLSAVIWAPRVPVTRRAPLTGIRLPRNPALHLFGLTLETPTEHGDPR